MSKQYKDRVDIDHLAPTRGLIDLADHSKGEGPLLIGYELDEVFDDIILAVYKDIDSTGDNIVRDGIVIPGNAADRAWRVAEVILTGPNCKQVTPGKHIIFPNEFGVRASNLTIKGGQKISQGVFLNEQRIFGTCDVE
tara:strand:- start:25 stop:438 length:414 start_codon:yes stop_codon:yes gene_type:complete